VTERAQFAPRDGPAAVDRIGFDTHRLAKRAKDPGSAAVLLALAALLLCVEQCRVERNVVAASRAE
jgi:hypothetical protein